MAVTSDSILHVRNTSNQAMENQIVLSLMNLTAISFFDDLTICGGDYQGKVELASLRYLSHLKQSSITLEYHKYPIELTKVCSKELLSSGCWIITFAKGCFAIWDSTAHLRPLSVFYCNLPFIENLVDFSYF